MNIDEDTKLSVINKINGMFNIVEKNNNNFYFYVLKQTHFRNCYTILKVSNHQKNEKSLNHPGVNMKFSEFKIHSNIN